MKSKKVLSVVLAFALLVSLMIVSTISVKAADSDTLKVWKVADFVADDSDRTAKNADGSITSKKDVNNHLVWGMSLGETGSLPAGTYYLKYTYKVTGTDSVGQVEDQGRYGFWEFAGKNARFGPGVNKDGDEVELGEDDEWISVVDQIEFEDSIGADQELRFKNLWNSGDFYLSIGAQVVLSKNDTPLNATATADIATDGGEPTPTNPGETTKPTTKPGGEDGKVPQTGDAGILLAMVTAGAAVFGGLKLKKKK